MARFAQLVGDHHLHGLADYQYRDRDRRIERQVGRAAPKSAQRDGVNTPLDRYSYRVAFSPSIDATMQLREADGTRAQIIIVRHDKENRQWTDIVVEIGGANG